MARPKADPVKVAAAVAAVRNGAPLPAAASAQGIGLSTLKRALLAHRGTAAPAPPPPARVAPAASASQVAAVEAGAPSSAPPPAATGVAATIAAALAELGDDPEAQIVGAMLRELGGKISGLDPAKLPAAANAVRTLSTTLREMRPARPPSPDVIAERLRELDVRALRKIEQHLDDADRVRARRIAALKGWGTEHLSAELADELATLVDGLDAPIAAPPTHGTA